MITRTDPDRIVEKFASPTVANDTIVCPEGDVVVMAKDGRVTNVAGPGHYNAPDVGLEAYFIKAKAYGLKAGGPVGSIVDAASGARVNPRVFMEYALMVTDPTRFLTGFVGAGTPDDDALRSWVSSQLMMGVKSALPTVSLRGDPSDLIDKVRTTANAKLADFGLEIAQIVSVNVNFSEADVEAMKKGR